MLLLLAILAQVPPPIDMKEPTWIAEAYVSWDAAAEQVSEGRLAYPTGDDDYPWVVFRTVPKREAIAWRQYQVWKVPGTAWLCQLPNDSKIVTMTDGTIVVLIRNS